MKKIPSHLRSCEFRSTASAPVCLALGTTDSNPPWRCCHQEKLPVLILTVIPLVHSIFNQLLCPNGLPTIQSP
jgi:hypothetical protein